MGKSPSFNFYVRNWLCSKSVSRMSGDAVKAYVYMLCESWLEEERGTLDGDDESLSLCARVSLEKWKQIKKDVLRAWVRREDGKIYNDKMLEVSDNLGSYAERGHVGGIASAKKRASGKEAKGKQSPSKPQANGKIEIEIEIDNKNESENDKKNNIWRCLAETKVVIDYFNERFGKKYKYAKESCQNIQGRLNEGYTFDDCVKVIEVKCRDTFFIQNPKFLNPVTLFRPTKFPLYLNEIEQMNLSPATIKAFKVGEAFAKKHNIPTGGKDGQSKISEGDKETVLDVSDTGH